MAGRTAIFIDGGYLDYVLRDMGLFGKLDYAAFIAALTGGSDLLRAYYYHCLPYQTAHPTAEESKQLGAMQKFLDALERIPRTEVCLGKLEFRGTRADGRPIYQQKRVDSQIATDLVLLSAKHRIDEAVVVTGDSDFLPAIQIAKDEGVVVRLVHGEGKNRPHNDLWKAVDERWLITPEWLSSAFAISPTLPPL